MSSGAFPTLETAESDGESDDRSVPANAKRNFSLETGVQATNEMKENQIELSGMHLIRNIRASSLTASWIPFFSAWGNTSGRQLSSAAKHIFRLTYCNGQVGKTISNWLPSSICK